MIFDCQISNKGNLGRGIHFWDEIYDYNTLIGTLVASLYHAGHLLLIFNVLYIKIEVILAQKSISVIEINI